MLILWRRVSHTEALGSAAVHEGRGLIEDCRMEFDSMLIDSTRVHLTDENFPLYIVCFWLLD